MFLAQDDLERIFGREELTFEDVKFAMRSVRYGEHDVKKVTYANSLLREAGDYLPSYALTALVRADCTEEEAAVHLERSKVFFLRLVELLPSVLRFFKRRSNLFGIISCIDDCHSDFHATALSPRKDRQIRETKELITNALEAAVKAAATLESAERHFDIEFDGYRQAYYADVKQQRHLDELIHELKMCSGVLEIVKATVDLSPRHLILTGNDKRTTVVNYAYQMSTMWEGPKLVTTPGSEFASLCSLLFEAVSGEADASLSGAINRYARSDDRKQWDKEGEQQKEDDRDNFAAQRSAMRFCLREIELCRALLDNPDLSSMAKTLLLMRINWERQKYDEANNTYGPRQVYIGQLNAEQVEDKFADGASRLSPEKLGTFAGEIPSLKSLGDLDVSLGQARRSARGNNV